MPLTPTRLAATAVVSVVAATVLIVALSAPNDARGETSRGTNGGETLRGTPQSDRLFGRGGADRLIGRAGRDRLDGGGGNDRLDGGAGADRLRGQAGNDRMWGRAGNDRLEGGRGKDILNGGGGRDQLIGGPGADRLVGNRGRDVFAGGAGNDRIFARDRVGNELVRCGPGRDVVVADRTDRVARDCEVVKLPATSTPGSPTPAPTPAPTPTPTPPKPSPTPEPGLPDFTAGFRDGLKMNAAPIPPAANAPHGSIKNVWVNQPRQVLAPAGTQSFPYPNGTVVVKTGSSGADDAAIVAVMRKVQGADPQHGDWVFEEFSRSSAGQPYSFLAGAASCWGCHSGATSSDWVFTTLDP